MSGNQFNFSLVVRADVAAGKSGLNDLSTSMRQVSTDSDKAAAAARKQASYLQALAAATVQAAGGQDQLAAAERRAQDARSRALIAPLANPATTVAPMLAAFRATETAAGSLRSSIGGLTVSIGAQAQEMVETAAASRTYQIALDDIRASFNPLFAASRQYEMQLDRIAEAEKIGAITAREAAAARTAAANTLMPVASGGRGNAVNSGAYTANIGAQGFDIGVTAAMGMNPAMIGLQQGSQLAGIAQQMGGGAKAAKEMASGILSIFNPTALVTIGLTTLAAFGIQALMSLRKETKTWDQHLEDLDATLGRMKTSLDRVGNVRLSDTFGNLTSDVRGLSQGLAELDRVSELKSLQGVIDGFLQSEVQEGWGQFIGRNIAAGMSGQTGIVPEALLRPATSEATNYNTLGASNTYEDFKSRTAEMARLVEQGDVKGFTAQLLELQSAMSGGKAFTGMSDGARKLLAELAEIGIKTAETEALWNGSARGEVVKRQTDQIVTSYKQEAELAFASAQFGEDSLEVERLRGRQARETLAIRLEDIGVQKGSVQWLTAYVALATRQRQAEEAAQEARRERVRGQEDEIAAINREISLIGSSNAVRARANALAEAEIRIRKQKLEGMEAEEERARAIARANAEITLLRDKAMDDVATAGRMDGFDASLAGERNLFIRAAIEGEKEYSRVIAEGGDAELARASATRVRNKALADADAAKRKAIEDIATDRLMDGFDRQIAGERNPYTRAAIEAEKEYARVIAEGGDAEWAAEAAASARAKALGEIGLAQADLLRTQSEQTQQLQLELALVGQTAEVRARVLALAQAERDIRQSGMEGDMAEQYRRDALGLAESNQLVEAQADAWARVQSAGENAVDAVLDKLKAGDIAGAFEELAAELEKGLFDLSIRNPLKNALLGTNLGTMQDVGGLGGIWGKLTGRNGVDEAGLAKQAAMPVGMMQVMAQSVMINGAGAMSFLSGMNGPGAIANMPGAPGAYGGSLGGSGDVQSQVWAFFAQKGLKPHQIAAIMGNVQAESAFNPMAVGDGGTSFGLFQHHAERGKGLLNSVGGQAGLGNVNAQLEYVWKELLTSENGVLKRLMAAPDVQQATSAFVGFERPQGWSSANPTGAHNWTGRLGSAEVALAKFGTTAQAATGDLGTLGTGFDVFGSALARGLNGAASGGAQGGLMGFLGTLATGIAGKLKIPGFAGGGDFGGGLRVVGEEGPELEFTGPSRILNANLTRSILTSRPPNAANGAPSVIQLQPVLVNNTARQVDLQVEETTDARGQRQQRYVISDVVGDGLATPGGKAARNMSQVYGVTRPARRRS